MTKINEYNLRKIHYEQMLNELESLEKSATPEVIDSIIKKIKILEEFASDKKRFFCLFEHKLFQPIYLSNNVATESGYTLDKYYDMGFRMMIKHIHCKQLSLFYKLYLWGNRFRNLIGEEKPSTNTIIFIGGIKFRDRWGKWRTFVLKQKIVSVTKANHSSLSFIEGVEITSIYKADFTWLRLLHRTDNHSYCRVYFSNEPKKEYADLLSNRELEILQLIVQKKSSKEIAKLLSISLNTVQRHRKNMIAKVGVTDMTALIYICHLCQLL